MRSVSAAAKSLLLAAALLRFAAAPAEAAPAAPPGEGRRPRIGVVLSGGGARGAAHVGVLKVLEELRVPVDFVVGTSMGSAVGGLYASGLTPEELEGFFRNFQWKEAFSDRPSREGLSFRRKQDDFDFLVGYGIGVRDFKLRFPLGVSQGQVFLGELRALGWMTQEYPDFNELPIPFRAVAVDLITAEPVIISSGDLALAIRASVSIAPLFAPIELRGRLLVDGGYLNNIPVDVARSLGADRVIVIDIGTPLSERQEIRSIFDVAGQTSRLGGTEFDRRQIGALTPRDLLLRPELHGMSFVDFDKITEAMRWGEEAARAAAARLRAFSVSEEEYRSFRDGRKPRRRVRRPIDRIRIQSDANIGKDLLLRMVRQKIGEPVDPFALKEDLLRMAGLGYFDYVDYSVVEDEGRADLVIRAPRLYWGPGNLRFGLELAEDFRDTSLYSLDFQYTQRDMDRWGSEAKLQAGIGTDSEIQVEYYRALSGRWGGVNVWTPVFLAPRAGYFSRLVDLAVPGSNAARYRAQAPLIGFDVGTFFSNVVEARAGVERAWFDADVRFGDVPPGSSSVYWNDAAYFGRLTADTLDKTSFPRKGAYAVWELRDATEALGSERENLSSDLGGAAFASRGKHTVGTKILFSTNLDTHTETPRLFQLGGLLRLSGFPLDRLVGSERILGQLRYYWNPFKLGGMPFYLGSAVEWGGTWFGRRRITYESGIWSGTGFVGLETPLGPLFLGSSLAEGGRFAQTLFLGHSF